MKLLCAEKSGLWFYIKTKSELPDSEVRGLVKLIFEYANLEDISKFDNLESLTEYFEELQDPFAFFGTFKNVKNLQKFISTNKIRFVGLDLPTENQIQLFQLIYAKNHYQINEQNIQAIIKGNKKEHDSEQLKKSHYTTLSQLDLEFLLEYIDSNIEEYISNVMTFMNDNTEESEDTVVDIINREEVKLEAKEKVLNSQNTVVQSIDNIDDLEVKQLALSHHSIFASWENVAEYYEEIIEEDKSEFDESIIDFLNEPQNYEKLCKVKLNTINATSDFIKRMSRNLLSCHELSIDAYTKLLDSLPYAYNSINYSNYELERLNVLLDKRKLTLSSENFEGLKAIDSKLSLRLVEDNQDKFKTDFSKISLDSDDWSNILKTSRIDNQNKLDLIQAMDNGIIIDNRSIARTACELLPINKLVQLDYEVLEAMFQASYNTERRVCLLNLHFSSLTDDQIQSLTEKLGEDYEKIFMRQHKPTFPNTDYNLKFFEKLQDQDLIIRHEVKEKKDIIKVFAKY